MVWEYGSLTESVPECKVSHSLFLSFYYLGNIYEDRLNKNWAEISACGPLEVFNAVIMLLGNLPVSVVACWIEVKEAKAQTQEFLSLLIQM